MRLQELLQLTEIPLGTYLQVPAELPQTRCTQVERLPVCFFQMIAAVHAALVLDAMVHAENVPRFMRGGAQASLKAEAKSIYSQRRITEAVDRPHRCSVSSFPKNEDPPILRPKIAGSDRQIGQGVLWTIRHQQVMKYVSAQKLPVSEKRMLSLSLWGNVPK